MGLQIDRVDHLILEFEYRLFVEKRELCNTEHVKRFLQQHIQDVALERESSSELVFGIERGASRSTIFSSANQRL